MAPTALSISPRPAATEGGGIRTTATPDGDGWRLNGHKRAIGDGAFSDFFVVSARTDGTRGSRGISLFLVDNAAPGVSVGRDLPMMGLRGSSHVELTFDGVKLGPEHLLSQRGRGLGLVLATIGRIRLFHIGARAVSMARRMLGMMIDHANERHQFGRPIGDFQMVQTMLADSAIELHGARTMVLDTAAAATRARRSRRIILDAKYYRNALGVCRIGRTEEAKECWSGLQSDYRLHESMLSQIVGLGYPLPPT